MTKPSQKLPDRPRVIHLIKDQLRLLAELLEGLLHIRPDVQTFSLGDEKVIGDFHLRQLLQLLTAAAHMLEAIRAKSAKTEIDLGPQRFVIEREIGLRISKLDSVSTSISLGDFIIDDQCDPYRLLQIRNHLDEALRLMREVEMKDDQRDVAKPRPVMLDEIEQPDDPLFGLYGPTAKDLTDEHPVFAIERMEAAQDAADPDTEAVAQDRFDAAYRHDETSLGLLKSTPDDKPDDWTDDYEAAAQAADDIQPSPDTEPRQPDFTQS